MNQSETTETKRSEKTPITHGHSEQPKYAPKNVDTVLRDPDFGNKYLLTQISDYDERHKLYGEMAAQDEFEQFSGVFNLQCYLYWKAKDAGVYVRQVKPLPAYAPKLSRIKKAITDAGGMESAKAYFDWILSRGGDRWLMKYGWRSYSINALYCTDAVADFLASIDGVDADKVRRDSIRRVSDAEIRRRENVMKGEWTEPETDSEDHGIKKV